MTPQPNENGAYVDDDAECIAWPVPAGCNAHAEIHVLQVGDIWLSAHSYQMGGSDLRGGGGPLMKRVLAPDHATRKDAVAYQAGRLLRSIDTSDCKRAPAIRLWLENLTVAPVQADLFAKAA